MGDTTAELQTTYLELINQQLPERAKQTSMPVRFDHCFARIVLDNLFGGCWYDHLSRKRPAYKQLNKAQLVEAIAIAQKMLANPQLVTDLNKNSLHWRSKMKDA